jgi:hypothetical protein
VLVAGVGSILSLAYPLWRVEAPIHGGGALQVGARLLLGHVNQFSFYLIFDRWQEAGGHVGYI